MLANALPDKEFSYQKVKARLRNKKDKDFLEDLVLISLALLKGNDLHLPWPLTDAEKKKNGSIWKLFTSWYECQDRKL